MEDLPIDYADLEKRAMRQVVRWCLEKAAQGAHGSHHFKVGFHTRHPGVDLPESLRAQYPDRMVIQIRQHFRDLEVFDDRFEVTLSFHQQWTRITVPFEAVSEFWDEAVPRRPVEPQDGEAQPELQVLEDRIEVTLWLHDQRIRLALPFQAMSEAKDPSAPRRPPLEVVEAKQFPQWPIVFAVEPREVRDARRSEDTDADREDGIGQVLSLDAFRDRR